MTTTHRQRYIVEADAAQYVQGVQAGANATVAFDKVVDALTKSTLAWQEETQRLINTQGEAVRMSQLEAAAAERLQEAGVLTTEAYTEQIQTLDALLEYYKQDALATAQLMERKQSLANEVSRLSQSQQQGSQVNSQATNTLFQLSRGLEDAKQFQFGFGQGVQATSNNVTAAAESFAYLSAQSGGAMAAAKALAGSLVSPIGIFTVLASGISVLAAFGDELDVFDTAKEKAADAAKETKEYAKALQGLIKLDNPLTKLFAQATPEQLQLLGGTASSRLEAARQELAAAELAQQKVLLDIATASAKEFEEAEQAVADANSKIREQEGILDAILAVNRERRVLEEQLDDLKAAGFTITSKTEKAEKSIAQTQQERLADLRTELAAVSGAEGVRLAAMEAQARQLEVQVQQARELAKFRFLRESGTLDNPTPVAGDTSLVLSDDHRAFVGRLDRGHLRELPGLSEGGIKKYRELRRQFEAENEKMADAVRRTQEQMAESIQNGIAQSITTLASSIGDLADGTRSLTDVTKQIIGDFATQMGQTLIGFGTAGIAIRKFIVSPELAIAGGAGLIVLGSMLKRQASSQAASFSSGQPSSVANYSPNSRYGNISDATSYTPRQSRLVVTVSGELVGEQRAISAQIQQRTYEAEVMEL